MESLDNEHQKMLEQSQQEDWPVTDLVLLMMKRGGAGWKAIDIPRMSLTWP